MSTLPAEALRLFAPTDTDELWASRDQESRGRRVIEGVSERLLGLSGLVWSMALLEQRYDSNPHKRRQLCFLATTIDDLGNALAQVHALWWQAQKDASGAAIAAPAKRKGVKA